MNEQPIVDYYVTQKENPHNREVKKNYAYIKRGRSIGVETIASDVTKYSSLSKGDLLSAFDNAGMAIARHLSEGKTVTMPGLGTFKMSISSEGADTPEQFTSKNIKKRRILFTPDKSVL
ncbi:MAG: HU domain-containing protein, partial [Streptococcaceae bacterium]|nr:HU domain-containing protein [Streptococcaceae bacterium]